MSTVRSTPFFFNESASLIETHDASGGKEARARLLTPASCCQRETRVLFERSS